MSLAVENALEDWMGLYNSVVRVSLLPYPPLEREIPQLRLRCDARDEFLLLVPRRIKTRKRILFCKNVTKKCLPQ